jgi:hypothetical protein
MKQFFKFAEHIFIGKNKVLKLHDILYDCSPFSHELNISIVLALSDRMPSDDYIKAKRGAKAIYNEILKLESVGKSIIEHIIVLYDTTNQKNWNLLSKEIDTKRLEALETSNVNMLAK